MENGKKKVNNHQVSQAVSLLVFVLFDGIKLHDYSVVLYFHFFNSVLFG
jgi:hypothetical protein